MAWGTKTSKKEGIYSLLNHRLTINSKNGMLGNASQSTSIGWLIRRVTETGLVIAGNEILSQFAQSIPKSGTGI